MINPAMIVMAVVGVLMLIIGGSILNIISTGGNIGDCNATDYDGSGTIDAADKATRGYQSCDGNINIGFSILTIMGVMMIVVAVISMVKSAGLM